MYHWIAIVALIFSPYAVADWALDSGSSHLSFVSVKNAQIAEAHTFTRLDGNVTEDGNATVNIDLNSVETSVPTRNQRMREMLFETGMFPNATFKAHVPVKKITDLKAGRVTQIDLQGTLSIHGKEAQISVPVSVTRADNDSYIVDTVKPVVISASQFDLGKGIEKLREVAGLDSITPSVPVDFSLRFVKS